MKSRRGRSNPADLAGAARLSEAFHGRPAKRITEYTEEVHEHAVLADLGALLEIRLRNPAARIEFDPGTRLASSEDGRQLYVERGDQSIDLARFPEVDASKQKVVLGEVAALTYACAKQHLGREDKISGPYEHLLAEEGGSRPLLVYDTLNSRLELVGGTYHIDLDMDGGTHSAGIRD